MSSVRETIARDDLRARLIAIGQERRRARGDRNFDADMDEFQRQFWGDLTPDEVQSIRDRMTDDTEPDPLLTDLARLLTDPRVPDAYAESVRAELREIAYRMRLVAEQEAA